MTIRRHSGPIFGGILLRQPVFVFSVIAALVSLTGLQMDRFADDPGVGWHLANGELILRSWRVPHLDPFLGGVPPRPWVSDQWLGDVIFAALMHIGSWSLVYALLTAIYFLTFFGVLYGGLSRCRPAVSAIGALCAILIAFKAAQIHFILRPVVFSFLGFAIVYRFVLHAEREGTVHVRDGLVLGLLFLVWANVHPAFILGLVALGSLPAALLIRMLGGGAQAKLSGLRRSAALLLLCALCTLLNPSFFDLHRSILALGESPYFMALHDEWRPIQFSSVEGRLVLCASMALILVGIVTRRELVRRTQIAPLLLLGIFTYTVFKAVRFVPFWGITASYPIAIGVTLISSSTIVQRVFPARIRRALGWIEKLEVQRWSALAVSALVLIVCLVPALLWNRVLAFSGPFGPTRAHYPYDAVERLLQYCNSKSVRTLNVASIPEWGGFLTYFGAPCIRPVIDDRNTLLGEDFYRRYLAAFDDRRSESEAFDRLSVRFLLIPRAHPRAAEALAGNAKPFFVGERAVVIER